MNLCYTDQNDHGKWCLLIFSHACFVVTWHLDHFEKWRVINKETRNSYIGDDFIKETEPQHHV